MVSKRFGKRDKKSSELFTFYSFSKGKFYSSLFNISFIFSFFIIHFDNIFSYVF